MSFLREASRADLAPLQRDCENAVDVLCLKGGTTAFRDNLEAAGIRVYDFGAGTSVYSPLNIFRIIPFLKRYEIVHVHLFPAQYWVASAKILSCSSVPLITTEHNTQNRRSTSGYWKAIDRFFYRRYESIVCCASAVEKIFVDYLKNQKRKIVTISNGVNLERFSIEKPLSREKLNFSNADFLLIQVSRFHQQKDQDCMIRALKKLPESVHAVFAGDGARRKDCEKLAEELGVRSRAHFLGVRADVPALLKAADVIICSSRYEGLSLSSVEGMAAGKPVVASDVPGLAEVVGGAGILFPQGDESALADAVSKLASDREFYAKIAAACSRRAQNFDIRKTATEYLKIYGEVRCLM